MEPVGRSKVLNALRDLDFGFFSRFRIGNSSTPHSCSMWHQSKRQLSGMSASCQAVEGRRQRKQTNLVSRRC